MKRLILLAVVAAGCGSDPVNAAGTYTLAVTNRDNGCPFTNWTVGMSYSNIHLTILQSGDGITGDFKDYTATVLDFAIGTHTMGGNVDGDVLDMTGHGTKTYTNGACTYTYDAHFHSTLTGDALSGRIEYTAIGNGSIDCNGIDGCVTFQDMNGTRPPT